MDDFEKLQVTKQTQKFVSDLADLKPEKRQNVITVLNSIEKQQIAEANLESKRGWRYMWQRTPKPYLLMLGYLVFLAPVGGVGYNAIQYISDSDKRFFLIILATVLLLPLLVVFYLSHHYIKQGHPEEKEQDAHPTINKPSEDVPKLD